MDPVIQGSIDIFTKLNTISKAMRVEAETSMDTKLVESLGLQATWTPATSPLWKYADEIDAVLAGEK